MAIRDRTLTADLVFRRLEELRELLRLTGYLAGFRRVAGAPEPERARKKNGTNHESTHRARPDEAPSSRMQA